MDIAASIQKVTEDIVLKTAHYLYKTTGMKDLCLAGGVALNCVGNGRILRESPFENVWIQPAAGDAGGALGVVLFIWHQLLDNPRTPRLPDGQSGSLLGPKADDAATRQYLESTGARYKQFSDEDELCDFVADKMANEKVVGFMQGRMEFGPRALGGRSIIGDARSKNMQSVMNLKIKFRESFRPFAPSVLRNRVQDYFEMRDNEDSPYMLLVAPVREDKRTSSNNTASVTGTGSWTIEETLQIGVGTSNTVSVGDGGTLSVGNLVIQSGNEFNLDSGGTFAISTNFNAAADGFSWNDDEGCRHQHDNNSWHFKRFSLC